MRNERTARMLQSALERESGVQNYVFGDLTADVRLRRERCAHATLKRMVLGKHHVRVRFLPRWGSLSSRLTLVKSFRERNQSSATLALWKHVHNVKAGCHKLETCS